MYHPNIRETGEVCISILHPPGDDTYGYEDRAERWLPIHTVESIFLSMISMLSDPNCESPENVDAAKTYRSNKGEYMRKVRRTVEQAYEFC
jgi:ubiquitin-conjugating enzyme E2 G1